MAPRRELGDLLLVFRGLRGAAGGESRSVRLALASRAARSRITPLGIRDVPQPVGLGSQAANLPGGEHGNPIEPGADGFQASDVSQRSLLVQLEDEVCEVPQDVPDTEGNELLSNAGQHVKPVLHVQAGPLSAGWTGAFRRYFTSCVYLECFRRAR